MLTDNLIQYQFGFHSCFHRQPAEIALGIGMGIIVHFLCAYVTLPLYALVTQVNISFYLFKFEKQRQMYLPALAELC